MAACIPDRHTYVRTSTWNERACDLRADKVKVARQRRNAERSLLNLQQRFVCNGSTEVSASNEPDDVRIESSVDASGNAFFAVSSEAGEKDMAAVSLAAKLSNEKDKNHVSVPDIYSPAIETLKDDPSETRNGVEENPPDQRNAVCLECRPGKKVWCDPLDLRLRNNGSGRTASGFRQDEEKNDKKRRAELILRQSIENQQELTQLLISSWNG